MILIDADTIIYVSAYIAYINDQSLRESKKYLDNFVKSIMTNTKETKYYMFLTESGQNNFRYSVYEDYKKIRKDRKIKENNLKFFIELKDYLKQKYCVVSALNCEDDDLVALAKTIYPEAIIASSDIDLSVFPGKHYNIKNKEQFNVDNPEGEIWLTEGKNKKIKGNGYKLFWAMMLKGDKDECPGLPLYGPVKAYNVLNHDLTYDEMKQVVFNEYINVYNDYNTAKEMFKRNYKLLWLINKTNTNFTLPACGNYTNF